MNDFQFAPTEEEPEGGAGEPKIGLLGSALTAVNMPGSPGIHVQQINPMFSTGAGMPAPVKPPALPEAAPVVPPQLHVGELTSKPDSFVLAGKDADGGEVHYFYSISNKKLLGALAFDPNDGSFKKEYAAKEFSGVPLKFPEPAATPTKFEFSHGPLNLANHTEDFIVGKASLDDGTIYYKWSPTGEFQGAHSFDDKDNFQKFLSHEIVAPKMPTIHQGPLTITEDSPDWGVIAKGDIPGGKVYYNWTPEGKFTGADIYKNATFVKNLNEKQIEAPEHPLGGATPAQPKPSYEQVAWKPTLHTGELTYSHDSTFVYGPAGDGKIMEYHYASDGEPIAAHLTDDANGKPGPVLLKSYKPDEVEFPPFKGKASGEKEIPELYNPPPAKPQLHVDGTLEPTDDTKILQGKTSDGKLVHYYYDPQTGDPDFGYGYDKNGLHEKIFYPSDVEFPKNEFLKTSTAANFSYPRIDKSLLTQEQYDLIKNRRFTREILSGFNPADNRNFEDPDYVHETRAKITEMNNAIENFPLPAPVRVWRGVNSRVFKKFYDAPEGSSAIHSSFFQATSRERLGKSWGDKYFEVDLPAGTPAIPASNVTGIDEAEYLMQTGQRFKIVEKDPDRKWIRLEHVPRFRAIDPDEPTQIERPLLGVHLYHSSANDFRRFDSRKIGTGETALNGGYKLKGHGIYLAEEPKVAQTYYNIAIKPKFLDVVQKETLDNVPELTLDQAETIANKVWEMSPNDRYYQKDKLIDQGLGNLTTEEKGLYHAIDAAQYSPSTKAYTYRVLAHVDPNFMIDADKPMSEQSAYVLRALARAGISPQQTQDINQILPQTHDEMKNFFKAGIQGIKYKDKHSRLGKTAKPTHNYVVYDEDALDIAHKGYMMDGEWRSY